MIIKKNSLRRTSHSTALANRMAATCNILKYFFLFLMIIIFTNIDAQETDLPQTASIQLRPLDELLNDALQFSPVLKMQNINVDLLYSDLKLLKKEWANYISASGAFQAGNVRFTDNATSTGGPDIMTVSRENIFAVVGISIRVPLSDFLTKAERERQLKLQVEQEKFSIQQRELEIRQLVIRQYNDAMRGLGRVDIRTNDYNFHKVAIELAERYFREGTMSLDEYTTINNKSNEAAIRLEDAKLDAQLSLLLLKEVVGKSVIR